MPRTKKVARPFSYRPHPHLYEINTWVWLEELSEKHGRRLTLAGVPEEEWDALAALGFDLVWLMGIWKRSPASRRIARAEPSLASRYEEALPGWTPTNVVGSPYAVHAYRLDPRMGTWKGLDQVRRQLHARGLGLILDFVPNHTACDHPWVRAHPDYYVQGTKEDFQENPSAFFRVKKRGGATLYLAHGRDPYFPPWTDTAQLNYFNPATRTALLGELRRLAAHCDGVRCDMAMLVLNDIFARTWEAQLTGAERPAEEFWSQAVAALPGFVWIAEAYWDLEWPLQQLGFQFTYDKRLYDHLRHAPAEVSGHLRADWNYQKGLVRFLENHDEARAAAMFGSERLPAAATLTATLPGMRFYHQGQLKGRRRRLPVQLARAAAEVPDAEIEVFYRKLLAISNEEVFHRGEWGLLEVQPAGDATHNYLIAYRWRSAAAFKLVVVNLGAGPSQGLVPLSEEVGATRDYIFFDQLNDQTYERLGSELASSGLFVRLEAHRAHLFDVRPQ
jgi:glycosidase